MHHISGKHFRFLFKKDHYVTKLMFPCPYSDLIRRLIDMKGMIKVVAFILIDYCLMILIKCIAQINNKLCQ